MSLLLFVTLLDVGKVFQQGQNNHYEKKENLNLFIWTLYVSNSFKSPIWQKHGNLIKCFNVIINPFIWISIIVCRGFLFLDNENIGWLLYILVDRGWPDEPGIERRVLISKILCRIIRPEKLYFNFLLHFDRMKTFRKCSRFCKFSQDCPSLPLL